jgi:hypothetical protein
VCDCATGWSGAGGNGTRLFPQSLELNCSNPTTRIPIRDSKWNLGPQPDSHVRIRPLPSQAFVWLEWGSAED